MPTDDGPFTGYFEVTAPGYLAGLGYPRQPVTEDTNFQVATIHTLVADQSGLHPDPSRGAIAAAVLDCSLDSAPGVRFSADTQDDASLTAYTNGEGLPDPGLEATTADGIGVVAQLPPGPTVLTVDASVGVVAERSVHVRADALTWVHVSPTP